MTGATQPSPTDEKASPLLAGLRVALVGKLAGMSRRDAQQLIRAHGGTAVDGPDAAADLIVVGEDQSPVVDLADLLDANARRDVEAGTATLLTETQLWQRLGFIDEKQNVHRLYTPAMLADLLGVPLAIVRRWHRRGLIVPAREVRRLPYFDFQEVATARRLAELLAGGVSPKAIEKKLAAVARLLPGIQRPLAQLSIIVQGKQLLLRQGDGLLEPGGQLRFDFDDATPGDSTDKSAEDGATNDSADRDSIASRAIDGDFDPVAKIDVEPALASPAQLRAAATQLEDAGQLAAAADMYRAALAADGPDAETCFHLAELLYRLGDAGAARERYYMAVELDEDYVEARANLGCVLAEMGQHELAAAAFTGALAHHGDYPDAHYHLAHSLDELGRADEAEIHWRAFLELAPDSPWSVAAQDRLASSSVSPTTEGLV
jgi:tetratricopeptide (TPR) repeat protein